MFLGGTPLYRAVRAVWTRGGRRRRGDHLQAPVITGEGPTGSESGAWTIGTGVMQIVAPRQEWSGWMSRGQPPQPAGNRTQSDAHAGPRCRVREGFYESF